MFAPHHAFGSWHGFAYATPPALGPGLPLPASAFTPCPHSSDLTQYWNLNSCPSATALALALGPDLPRADQLYPGILGYSADRILTYLSLLIPAFSLPRTPLLLISTASSLWQCSPTNDICHSAASAVCFSPGHFRRRASRLVSCYALFECMAASEPTS